MMLLLVGFNEAKLKKFKFFSYNFHFIVYVLFVYNSNVYYFDLIQTELTTRIVQQMAAINHPHAF